PSGVARPALSPLRIRFQRFTTAGARWEDGSWGQVSGHETLRGGAALTAGIAIVLAKGLVGGVFVAAFALIGESVQPKSFSGGLRSVQPRDLAVRFAFGFGVSVVAGIVTLTFGSRAGGLFLAFPAILPASLTLIEEKQGRRQAEGNAVGAILGAVALVVFALI